MKKKIITTAFALLFATAMLAENQRVAVFDPTGNAESFIREIVREEISAVIVNAGGYTVLERSLINQVLEESRFQASGLVDDAQISEIGRMLGANLVLVTTVTQMGGGNFHISTRLIDVLTARVERQQTARTSRGDRDLIEVVERMTITMFGVAPVVAQPRQPREREARPAPIVLTENMLVANGRRVYQDGRRLTENEVRGLMAGTDAIRMYNDGLRRNRNGNIVLWSGVGAMALAGVIGYATGHVHEWQDSAGNLHTDDWRMEDAFVWAGLTGAFVTVPLVITGTTLKISSRRPIRNAVDMYNRSLTQTSHIEVNFGFTPNGVGMVVNF